MTSQEVLFLKANHIDLKSAVAIAHLVVVLFTMRPVGAMMPRTCVFWPNDVIQNEHWDLAKSPSNCECENYSRPLFVFVEKRILEYVSTENKKNNHHAPWSSANFMHIVISYD